MEVRWGFLGGGNVTEAKASPGGAFTQARSRVLAVARSNKDRAAEYARANAIPRAYGSVEELCADPVIDAVYICTPHHLHKEHALAAIRARKHVLCEKPLAISAEDCRTIVRAAQDANVLLAVPFYRRYYPVIERLRQVVESGRLGSLTSAQVINHGYFVPSEQEAAGNPRTKWRTALDMAGGGALTENGSHRLDLLVYFLGEAKSVYAETDRFEAWYEGEDQASVTIRFRNRAIAQFDESWCNRSPRDYFAISGTKGQAIIDDLEKPRLVVQLGRETEVIDVEPRSAATHKPVVADFVQALNGGPAVRCSGANALLTSQIIELAYRSAKMPCAIDIPLA